MAFHKVLNGCWHVPQLKITAAPNLLGDVGRDILRPAFGGVEGDYANRIAVLTPKQTKDDVFQIGRLNVSFAVRPAATTKIVHYDVDGLIVAVGHD